jgi:hypothetical protein
MFRAVSRNEHPTRPGSRVGGSNGGYLDKGDVRVEGMGKRLSSSVQFTLM